MTAVFVFGGVAVWLACGLWGVAWARRADWDRYPTLRSERPFPILGAVLGPLGLFAAAVTYGLPEHSKLRTGRRPLLMGKRR